MINIRFYKKHNTIHNLNIKIYPQNQKKFLSTVYKILFKNKTVDNSKKFSF
ncbi:hypothetical protein CNEO4_1000004 [Clostridium neonatale]|nr:hypothetical protein CNEO4_1000004 [Clostridium neonatale]CAI3592742.1 hypothetical protein CNEO3_480010 [Clostridium neonatale]